MKTKKNSKVNTEDLSEKICSLAGKILMQIEKEDFSVSKAALIVVATSLEISGKNKEIEDPEKYFSEFGRMFGEACRATYRDFVEGGLIDYLNRR